MLAYTHTHTHTHTFKHTCMHTNTHTQGAMSNAQIQDVERTVQEVIQVNEKVFAKEAPLSLAKEVQGLRAVFDEVSSAPAHTHPFHGSKY